MRRFIRAVLFVALLAAAFASVASALDFNDEAEEAPHGEVGKLYRFEMPSHGGCFYAPYRYVVESGKLAPGLKVGDRDRFAFARECGRAVFVPAEGSGHHVERDV